MPTQLRWAKAAGRAADSIFRANGKLPIKVVGSVRLSADVVVEEISQNQLELDSNQTQISELGFGRAANRRDVARLLNADGSFNVVKRGVAPFQSMSLYHSLLTTTWPRFFLWITALYLISNLLFAFCYAQCGVGALSGIVSPSFSDRLLQSFFFSVQTISTIGYGAASPQTLPANILVTAEALLGMFEIALVTGIVFARFARPVARIRFSDFALIAPFRGNPSLQVRMVNLRRSELIEPRAQMLFTFLESQGGRPVRRYHRLKLYLDKVAFFPLYWTVTHVIDEDSPLHGLNEDALRRGNAEMLILVAATDEAFAQTVHARRSYRFDEIIFDAKFDEMYLDSEDGRPAVDLGRLSSYQLLAGKEQ